MKTRRQKLILATVPFLLASASYEWPVFGGIFLCSSLILVGMLNQFLSIQSKELGAVLGACAFILALAACIGARLGVVPIVALTFFATLAGYGFAAARMGTKENSDRDNDDSPPRVKTGGGGDFGGGGASGNY